MNIGQKYVWPLVLGFAGMFICHFGLFLCHVAGIEFVAYVIVYPMVYSGLAIVLTLPGPRLWLSNALYLCVIPFLYWYLLLASDGKLNWRSFSFFESSGMSVIIVLTAGVSALAAFAVSKAKKSPTGGA
jgi:hypothetical protein